jgi:hypothetical protein
VVLIMNRAANHNSLLEIARLQQADRFYTQILKSCGLGVVVGVVLFLCLAIPAGALWK